MTAHAHEHHGPPAANQSSRIAPTVLGMLLFIASEAMLFGSFFAALFFARVVNPAAPGHWPPPPFHFPVFVAGVNTCILVTSSFTMHWSVQSIRRNDRAGMKAGVTLTILLGLAFLLTQAIRRRRVCLHILRPHGPSRRPRLHRPLAPDLCRGARVSRPLLAGALPWSRDPRDLLALRRRNVDRGVHDGLSPLRAA